MPHAEIDRRLALLAFKSGDYKEAQQRFSELLSSGEGNEAAQLYLADIAARDGDPERPSPRIAGCTTPRSRCRRARAPRRSLLGSTGDSRTEALALLDDYAAEHPEEELDLTLTKAQLLADHGEADAGLAMLSAASSSAIRSIPPSSTTAP